MYPHVTGRCSVFVSPKICQKHKARPAMGAKCIDAAKAIVLQLSEGSTTPGGMLWPKSLHQQIHGASVLTIYIYIL